MVSDLDAAAERAMRGDSSAFEEIVEATSAELVRLSARMLGNVADAEDAVQEAYVRAYRALTGGQFDRRSRVRTWLYRIAINATIDAKRKRKRTAADELVDPGWEGGAAAEATLALREIADWLGDLPDEQRTALVLKAVDGMSSAEIAEIMECSEGAVEQRLVRARTALRQRRDT